MAVYKSNNFNANTPAADATTSSTATSGDQITRVRNNSATAVYTNTGGSAINGVSIVCDAPTAGTDSVYYLWDHAGTAAAGIRAAFRFDGNPDQQTQILALRRASSAVAAYVSLRTDGTIRLTCNNSNNYYTTSVAVTAGAVYQVDLTTQPGTGATDGKVRMLVMDQYGNPALGMSAAYEKTDADCGTGDIVRGLVGILDGGGVEAVVDDVTMTDTYGAVGFAAATTYTFGRHVIIG